MNAKKIKKTEGGASCGCACVCQGAGPALTEILRRWGPPGEARRHFETARW